MLEIYRSKVNGGGGSLAANGSYMKRSHVRTFQLTAKLSGYVLYTVLSAAFYQSNYKQININTMENFFYNDNFYSELSECCDYNDWDKEEIESYPDDFKLEVECSELSPIVEINAEWITEKIDEERFSEYRCDDEVSKIMKILNENIDFEKINRLIPKLYYGNRKKHYFTKADLLEAVS